MENAFEKAGRAKMQRTLAAVDQLDLIVRSKYSAKNEILIVMCDEARDSLQQLTTGRCGDMI